MGQDRQMDGQAETVTDTERQTDMHTHTHTQCVIEAEMDLAVARSECAVPTSAVQHAEAAVLHCPATTPPPTTSVPDGKPPQSRLVLNNDTRKLKSQVLSVMRQGISKNTKTYTLESDHDY